MFCEHIGRSLHYRSSWVVLPLAVPAFFGLRGCIFSLGPFLLCQFHFSSGLPCAGAFQESWSVVGFCPVLLLGQFLFPLAVS